MRAALALVAGGPLRVSTSAAALATIAFVATGNGAAMAGVLESPPSRTAAPQEADRD